MIKFKDLFVSLAAPSNYTVAPCNVAEPINGPIIIASTPCCGGGASLPGGGPIWFPIQFNTPIWNPVDFNTAANEVTKTYGSLKEYLRAALEQVETRENVTQEGQKPQTVAEIEMLEEKLTGALDELRARKAKLQNEAA